jgi:hypothetical protein
MAKKPPRDPVLCPVQICLPTKTLSKFRQPWQDKSFPRGAFGTKTKSRNPAEETTVRSRKNSQMALAAY